MSFRSNFPSPQTLLLRSGDQDNIAKRSEITCDWNCQGIPVTCASILSVFRDAVHTRFRRNRHPGNCFKNSSFIGQKQQNLIQTGNEVLTFYPESFGIRLIFWSLYSWNYKETLCSDLVERGSLPLCNSFKYVILM